MGAGREPVGLVETGEAGHECHVVGFDGVVGQSEQGAVHVCVDGFAYCDWLAGEVEAGVGRGEVFGAGDGAEGVGWGLVREGEDEGGHVDYLCAVEVDEAEGCAGF